MLYFYSEPRICRNYRKTINYTSTILGFCILNIISPKIFLCIQSSLISKTFTSHPLGKEVHSCEQPNAQTKHFSVYVCFVKTAPATPNLLNIKYAAHSK